MADIFYFRESIAAKILMTWHIGTQPLGRICQETALQPNTAEDDLGHARTQSATE